MRIIARLDIKLGTLIKSVMYDGVRKLGNPKDFAKDYYDNGIDELMLINNTGSLYGTKLDLNLIKEIRDKKALPISAGGGINSYEDAINLIQSGSDKVVINSLIHKNPKEVVKIVDALGSSSVTGAIQFENRNENYVTLYEMAREATELNLIDTIKKYRDLGIGELLITDIKRDGCYTGLNRDIAEKISEFKNAFPIILSGGFNKIEDIDFYKDILSGVAISSVIHFKSLTVTEIMNYKNKIII